MWHIVWFKRDLRIEDHEALRRAAARGAVLPLYVVEPELWQQPDASGRQWAFVRESLIELRAALHHVGLPLLVRHGEIVTVLQALHRQLGISSLSAHQETGNGWSFARDQRVHAWCRQHSIVFEEPAAFGVVRGRLNRDRWSACWERAMQRPVGELRLAAQVPLPIDAGAIPDWPSATLASDHCPQRQRGGRREALALLASFYAERGRYYTRSMSSPLSAASACSRLSPHLAQGTIGLRELVHSVRRQRAALGDADVFDAFQPSEHGDAMSPSDPRRSANPWRRSLASFESRLHWHCHFIQKLESEPAIEFENVNRGFDGMREADFDRTLFNAWQQGETGWPFVDACMRMLYATGWINFRMRAMLMTIASYHLWLHWQEPALHLARLFTDYEPGIHFPQVQMHSGVTGINIPRIYNPLKQGLDQDPYGRFIRRWLPELRGVRESLIHTPWLQTRAQQAAAGCMIGDHYPAPIRDHEQAAREAKARYSAWRRHPDMHLLATAVLKKHGSRKRRIQQSKSELTPQMDLFGAKP
jgi:deoxyribodipyrimidine photo-lyase